MFERILVPTDGSALAAEAMPYVEQIPSAAVTLLTVNAEESVRWHDVSPAGEVTRVRDEPDGPDRVDRLAERLCYQGRNVEVRRETGDPAARILAAAAGADLIVMATHGRGGLELAMLGSVADRVVREGTVPTMVVRGRGGAARPVTQIVVPLDGFAAAEGALPLATRLAADLGLPIHLILVVGMPSEMRDAAPYILAQARRLQHGHFVVSSDIAVGDPAQTILARLKASDLVAMATRGHGGARRLVEGSGADRLVRLAPGPVLIQRAAAKGTARRSGTARDERPRHAGGQRSILLVAATKHGSTREIARSIAKELETRGFAVDLRTPADAPDPTAYDAAVIGSGVYIGRWLPEVHQFVERHRDQLRAMPVWLFSSGPLGTDDLQPKGDPFQLRELMEMTGARDHRMFADKLDMDELGPVERVMSKAVRAEEGDFRDWPAIWNWADEIADALSSSTRRTAREATHHPAHR